MKRAIQSKGKNAVQCKRKAIEDMTQCPNKIILSEVYTSNSDT